MKGLIDSHLVAIVVSCSPPVMTLTSVSGRKCQSIVRPLVKTSWKKTTLNGQHIHVTDKALYNWFSTSIPPNLSHRCKTLLSRITQPTSSCVLLLYSSQTQVSLPAVLGQATATISHYPRTTHDLRQLVTCRRQTQGEKMKEPHNRGCKTEMNQPWRKCCQGRERARGCSKTWLTTQYQIKIQVY